MRKLKVDMTELQAAFDSSSHEMTDYLDTETREAILVAEALDDSVRWYYNVIQGPTIWPTCGMLLLPLCWSPCFGPGTTSPSEKWRRSVFSSPYSGQARWQYAVFAQTEAGRYPLVFR